jgi:hypothetical protein
MPGPRCKVCDHPKRAEIDATIVAGQTATRRIAPLYGMSDRSVRRHKDKHVPVALAETVVATRHEHNLDALGGLQKIYTRLNLALDAADRKLYNTATGQYDLDAETLALLIQTAESLRRTIDSAARIIVFLQAQDQARREAEDAPAQLRALVLEVLAPVLGEETAIRIAEMLAGGGTNGTTATG